MFRTVALAASLGWASACSKEEYRAKFGAEPTYELLASPEPRLDGDTVVAHVRYTTTCKGGGSSFEAIAKEMPPGMDAFDVTLLRRDAPVCDDPLPVSTTWEGKVEVPLPTFKNSGLKAKPLMIAFPPDGAFEVYMLRSAYPPAAKAPSLDKGLSDEIAVPEFEEYDEYANMTPEEKTAKVQRELASQSPEDSVNHLEHCLSTPKSERVSCCCDEMIDGLRKKIAEDAANAAEAGANNITEEDMMQDGIEIDVAGNMADGLIGGLK